jgi:AcrR family transcriptional regulator
MEENTYHHGDLKNALIEAGVEILTETGLGGLSLRKVAKRAGVSHAAPYAHFKDKQALVAAIATAGHARIYAEINQILTANPGDPLRQLVLTALAYLDFSQAEPDLFRITFSGAIEKEQDYPDLVEMAHKNFDLLREITARGRAAGLFQRGPDDLLAQSLWGAVYGLISLLQQRQVSSAVLEQHSPRDLLFFTLNQMCQGMIDPQDF